MWLECTSESWITVDITNCSRETIPQNRKCRVHARRTAAALDIEDLRWLTLSFSLSLFLSLSLSLYSLPVRSSLSAKENIPFLQLSRRALCSSKKCDTRWMSFSGGKCLTLLLTPFTRCVCSSTKSPWTHYNRYVTKSFTASRNAVCHIIAHYPRVRLCGQRHLSVRSLSSTPRFLFKNGPPLLTSSYLDIDSVPSCTKITQSTHKCLFCVNTNECFWSWNYSLSA